MNDELDKEIQEEIEEELEDSGEEEAEEVIIEEASKKASDEEDNEAEPEDELADEKDFLTEDPVELDEDEGSEIDEESTPSEDHVERPENDSKDSSEETSVKKKSKKTIIFLVMGIIGIIAVAAGVNFGIKIMNKEGEKDLNASGKLPPPPALEIKAKKRILAPFFVLLKKSDDKFIAKVIIRINWDSVSDKRFLEEKGKIRNNIFRFLEGFVKSEKDLTEKKEILKEGLGIVIGKSMGLSSVKVLLDEVELI